MIKGDFNMWKRAVWIIALVMAVAGCGQSMEGQSGDEKKMEPAVFTQKMDNGLEFMLEVQYENIEEAKGRITEGKAGSFQLGEPLQVAAKVKNTTDKDFSFEGDPCSGRLSVRLAKDTVRVLGEGDIAGDVCIQSIESHTLKAGETIEAKAVFPLDKGLDAGKVEGQEVDLEPGKYTVRAHYAMQVMEAEIELYSPEK